MSIHWFLVRVLSVVAVCSALAGCPLENDDAKPFKIVAEPADAAVTAGNAATFSVEAKGRNLAYQWRRNGADIAGATSASYQTPATILADDGASFSVVVTSGERTRTSRDARLTVTAALSITTQPASVTVNEGQPATFSVVANGSGTLGYQWRRNGADIAGATGASHTTPATTAADDGALFSVVVSNSSGSVTSSNATLTVRVPPSITSQPANATASAGGTATFSVTATGSAPLDYQWRRDGADIAGATSASYTTQALTAGDDAARFSVVVSNAAGSVTSDEATLTVTPVLTTVDGLQFFGAIVGAAHQLWVTDGTPAGTRYVTGWSPPENESISVTHRDLVFARFQGAVYFPAVPPGLLQGSTLWRSDGTAAGTVAVTAALEYVKAPIIPCGGRLFFWARGAGAPELGLWTSDGTAAGTRQVGDVRAGTGYGLRCHASIAYFAGFTAASAVGEEPWRSDGTDAGTFVLKDLRVGGSSRPMDFASLLGKLYFSAENVLIRRLNISDGSEAGTGLAAGDQTRPFGDFAAAGGAVYFTGQADSTSVDLYRVDDSGVVTMVSAGTSPRSLTAFGDRAFFFGSATSDVDFEPYIVGSNGGVTLLTTINPDASAYGSVSSQQAPFAALDDRLLFAATTPASADEPWVTDGTADGTQLLRELVAGDTGSSPRGFLRLGNVVLFTASANAAGARDDDRLWVTDGTPDGTVLLTPTARVVYY